jgi:hypothetical protein
MKARDKMKLGKKKDESQAATNDKKDFLAPILKKMFLPAEGPLPDEVAIRVKMEALKSLKERLLNRAEII